MKQNPAEKAAASSAFSPAPTPPVTILAGIGALSRSEACRLIATLEAVNAVEVLQGASEAFVSRINKDLDKAAQRIEKRSSEFDSCQISTAALRHRLWFRLNEALSCTGDTPLSHLSSDLSANALGVRVSELLSPAIHARRAKLPGTSAAVVEPTIRQRLTTKIGQIRQAMATKAALPFEEVVGEEWLQLLSSEAVSQALDMDKDLDPELKRHLSTAHSAAHKAVLIGGGWAGFAGIVSGAGFAPYILAAQASAWVPFISGPMLVSLLATFINPITLAIGLGGLAWYGTGNASRSARGQVAARLAGLLAVRGSVHMRRDLDTLLQDFRTLCSENDNALRHCDDAHRTALRKRLAETRRIVEPPVNQSTEPQDPNLQKVLQPRGLDGAEAAVVTLSGGLTAADLIWHAAQLNPSVIKAADFSRTADLGDPVSFALEAWRFAAPGADISLRGYTAEQLALSELLARGHHVELAGSSTTPGFDLLVDGQPVQIKCGQSLSLLTDHFERYPDIPVIANAELFEQSQRAEEAWSGLVTTLPGMGIEEVEALIERTVSHASGLTEADYLPIAIAVGAARGGLEVWSGRLALSDLPAWLVLDGAARGGLASVGGAAGSWIGLVTIGPAGALVLGPSIGIAATLGAGALRNLAIDALQGDWIADVKQTAEALRQALMSSLKQRISLLVRDHKNYQTMCAEKDPEAWAWLLARSYDRVMACAEQISALAALKIQSLDDAIALNIEAVRLAPADASVLKKRELLNRHLLSRPEINESMRDNVHALLGGKKQQP